MTLPENALHTVDAVRGTGFGAVQGRVCAHTKGAKVTVTNLTGFTGACQEAMVAVLDAIATVGEERREHLNDAKLAVDKALHDAHSGEEWYLADHLRRGIKEVEASSRDAA